MYQLNWAAHLGVGTQKNTETEKYFPHQWQQVFIFSSAGCETSFKKKGAGVGGEKECRSSISFVLSRKCLVHSWKRLHSLSPVESCYFTI